MLVPGTLRMSGLWEPRTMVRRSPGPGSVKGARPECHLHTRSSGRPMAEAPAPGTALPPRGVVAESKGWVGPVPAVSKSLCSGLLLGLFLRYH